MSSVKSENHCFSIFHDHDKTTSDLSLKAITSVFRQRSSRLFTSITSATTPTYVYKKRNRLPPLQNHCFATILEDVLTQLCILGECNITMRNYKMQFDINELRDEKYGIEPCIHKDELFGIDEKNLESDIYKLNKHAADRKTCFTVLSNTYLDLALNGQYEDLIKYREDIEDQFDNFLVLIDEEAKNKEIRRDLRKQVRQQRNRIKSSVYEINSVVEELISKLENAANIRDAQERYVEKWQLSRSEQNDTYVQNKEAQSSSTITKYRIKLDDEQRVHSEVENLTKINICELLRQIEDCMTKYDHDIENMDYKITLMRVNYEKQTEIRLEMEQRLAEREVEIQKWIQFKQDREKVREYQKKMAAAALIVQAWWRGLLVRLQLGPFKPSLRKKKRNNKKNK